MSKKSRYAVLADHGRISKFGISQWAKYHGIFQRSFEINKNIPGLGPQKKYSSRTTSAAEKVCLSRMTPKGWRPLERGQDLEGLRKQIMSFRHSVRVGRGNVCESSFPSYWLQECPRNQSGRDKDSERNLSGICGEVAEWMRIYWIWIPRLVRALVDARFNWRMRKWNTKLAYCDQGKCSITLVVYCSIITS